MKKSTRYATSFSVHNENGEYEKFVKICKKNNIKISYALSAFVNSVVAGEIELHGGDVKLIMK